VTPISARTSTAALLPRRQLMRVRPKRRPCARPAARRG